MKKILVAIDDSTGAFKTIDYVGQLFAGVSDLKITLFHVLPNVPTEFWDDGHILDRAEGEVRKKDFEKWLTNQKLKFESVFRAASDTLTRRGINPQQIETKSISESFDVAGSILEETRTGNYQMLVVGRHGHSQAERLLMGTITSKIINHGAGIAICVVE